VALTVDLEEFGRRARELAEQVAGGGQGVIVARSGTPLAILAAPAQLADSGQVVGPVADLPRWEEWLHQMRSSFSAASSAPGVDAPQVALPEPPTLDKSMLGFDPGAGRVGSDQGREHLADELARLGVPVREEKLLAEVYSAVLALCEDKERVYEQDVRVLAQELIAEAPQRLRLLSVTMSSSTGLPATAEVTMEVGQGPAMRREHGDGPLDAAFKAIQRLTGLEPEVENFSVVAATRGSDAMAEAMIQLALDRHRVVGTGASTNVMEAGVHAYVNALNFLLEGRLEDARRS
jgi:hypothetical protein